MVKMSLERKRKFVIALAALGASTLMGVLGHLDGGAWASAMGAIVGLYSASEAYEGGQQARYSAKAYSDDG